MDPDQNGIVHLLKKSRYLKDIEDEKLQQLACISTMQTLPKGKILLKQNQSNKNVYIMVKGSVSVFIDKEFIYSLCRSGDILGEMSVITGGPSNATITADKDVDLVRIPTLDLKQIHGNKFHELHSALYQWFSSILTDKLYQTSQKAKQFESINRQLQSDLADAKSTQDRIFSAHTHPINGLPMTLKCEFSNILGGDLYAVYPVDESCHGILIGDVSGHGTGPCLISMMILNLFMAFSPGKRSSKKVMESINQMALQFMHQGKFVTLFYGVYNPATKELSYTNAGHHPALVIRRKKVMILPSTSGIPVGIMDKDISMFGEHHFQLEPGDRLLLFTDAIFEDHPLPGQKSLGIKGFIDYLSNTCHSSSKLLAEDIFEFSLAASHGYQTDDFTLMIFDQL